MRNNKPTFLGGAATAQWYVYRATLARTALKAVDFALCE